MLSDEVIDKVVERLVERMESANTFILKKIGENIKLLKSLTPTEARQMIQILRYGGDFDKILKELQKITNLNVKDIYEIFEEVAKNDYNFAKQFYDYRKKPFIPFEKNETLKKQINALAKISAGDYINLTNTRAIGFTVKDLNGRSVFKRLDKAYVDILDEAVLDISQGKETFGVVLNRMIKQFGESGLKTMDYESGRSIRLDSAIRMNIKGALRALHNEIQQELGEEFDADGVEISVHSNPAPDHEEVQGHQFSNEEFEKFQNDLDSVDYYGEIFTADYNGKDRRAISQYNCYHYVFSIVLGVNRPQYSSEQLRQIIEDNNKGFELDGKHYTNYEGTQLQRALERKIREQKDIQIMARESGNNELVESSQKNITDLSRKYKELSEISKLPTKLQRMRVSGYKRVKTT